MKQHVLVAPSGKRFAPDAGSENGWIVDIVTGIAEIDPELQLTCAAEQVGGRFPASIHPVDIGRRRSEELGGLLLPLRLARLAAGSAAIGGTRLEGVSLLHHALPFAMGRTFSILAALAERRGLPVVVGPIQTPLEWTGPDEQGGQLVSGQRPLRRLASATSARVWPLAGPALARASRATLRRASQVVVVGPPAAELAEAAGVHPERISVIPPPVRSEMRMAPTERHNDEPLRLVTAGYLIERKAVDDIVTVVGDLAEAGERLVLEVAGDGPAAPQLRRLADRHRATAVRFHGWLGPAELQALIRSCHVYVSMSRGESWGQAAADALASALVVVSAANTGTRSMAALGAPITTVPVGDRRRLAGELRRLCHTESAVLAALGTLGARWASATLAVPVVARQWHDLYRQAIAEGARRPPAVTDGGDLR